MMKRILMWEEDIVLTEQIEKECNKKKILVEEVNELEQLYQKLKKNHYLFLLISLEQLIEEKKDIWKSELKKIITLSNTMVIITDDLENEERELAAFECGAMEYLPKNKNIQISQKRIQRLFKPSKKIKNIQSDRKEMWNEQTGCIFMDGESYYFTKKEFQVIRCLLINENEILSREQLLKKVWNDKKIKSDRVIDTIIKQLRKKIKESSYEIITKYNTGFMMKKRDKIL